MGREKINTQGKVILYSKKSITKCRGNDGIRKSLFGNYQMIIWFRQETSKDITKKWVEVCRAIGHTQSQSI